MPDLTGQFAHKFRAVAGVVLTCANCHRPYQEHCGVHLVRCCPGTCSGVVADDGH